MDYSAGILDRVKNIGLLEDTLRRHVTKNCKVWNVDSPVWNVLRRDESVSASSVVELRKIWDRRNVKAHKNAVPLTLFAFRDRSRGYVTIHIGPHAALEERLNRAIVESVLNS